MRFNRRTVPLATSPKFKEEFLSMINDVMGNLAALFDRGVGITDNLDAVTVSGTTNGVANTEDAFTHRLGRVPVGFILISTDKAASVYASGTAFSSTQIFLKTSVTSAAIKLLVF